MNTGDTVRINAETQGHLRKHDLTTEHETATIKAVLTGLYGGGIFLDRPLYGIRYWNKLDLEIVEDKNV